MSKKKPAPPAYDRGPEWTETAAKAGQAIELLLAVATTTSFAGESIIRCARMQLHECSRTLCSSAADRLEATLGGVRAVDALLTLNLPSDASGAAMVEIARQKRDEVAAVVLLAAPQLCDGHAWEIIRFAEGNFRIDGPPGLQLVRFVTEFEALAFIVGRSMWPGKVNGK